MEKGSLHELFPVQSLILRRYENLRAPYVDFYTELVQSLALGCVYFFSVDFDCGQGLDFGVQWSFISSRAPRSHNTDLSR